jgi:hypothetical protein
MSGRSCEYCGDEHHMCDSCGAATIARICPACGSLTCGFEAMEACDARGEPMATVMVDADHAAYVDAGGVTPDPTLLLDYSADEPEPGTLLMVADRRGWATLHRVEIRADGKIAFGRRIPWPDGRTAARRLPTALPGKEPSDA